MLKSLKATTATDTLPAINIRIVYPATVPTAPVGPNKPRNLTAAAVLGLVLSFGIALGVERLNTTFRTAEELESFLELPNLALIPHMELPSGEDQGDEMSGIVVDNKRNLTGAEAFRGLRTTILHSSLGRASRVLLVSSTMQLEGKTMTSGNLAAILAKNEKDILVVDADMRRPSLHKLFHVPKEPGLSNFLMGEIDDLPIIATLIPNLFVVSSGNIPSHPAELLGSDRMREFLSLAKGRFSRIFIDSPPIMVVTDAVVLSTLVDAVILVVKAESTPRRAILETKNELVAVNSDILGTVLNNVSINRSGYYYRNYFYRYSSYYTNPSYTNPSGSRRRQPITSPGALGWVKDRVNSLRKGT
jgi:capsular exopolysaccharide synthesis family protein